MPPKAKTNPMKRRLFPRKVKQNKRKKNAGGPQSKTGKKHKKQKDTTKTCSTEKTCITVKYWDTKQVDQGWHGHLVGLSWNQMQGTVEEKWHWLPPKA